MFPVAAPIHAIPTEILIKILFIARDTNFADECHGSTKTIPKCALLSRKTTRLRLVCTGWNYLVISTPEFWNLINIDVPYDDWELREWRVRSKPFPWQLAQLKPTPPFVLKLWLDRSAQLPLYIAFEPPGPFCWLNTTSSTMDLLFASAPRWSFARLVLDDDGAERIFRNRSSPLPAPNSLVELDVEFKLSCKGLGPITRVFEYFAASPRLRSLNLRFSPYYNTKIRLMDAAESCLPMSQLTRLCFTLMSVRLDHVFAFCSACPSLTWLTLDNITTPELPSRLSMYPEMIVKYTLPQLKILELYTSASNNAWAEYFAKAIHFMDCPELQILSVAGSDPILDHIIFALEVLFKCCSSPPLVLYIRSSCRDIPSVAEFKTQVLENSTLGEIQVLDLAFPTFTPRELKCFNLEEVACHLSREIDDHVQRNPAVRATIQERYDHDILEKCSWSVGWGDYKVAPSTVKAFYADASVKYRHIPLEEL